MQGFAHHPSRHLRPWDTSRLRMTLWNVAVLALILGVLGSVVRYKVQAERFATVDRTLAERANEAGRLYAIGPPYAGRNTRATGRSTLLDPMVVAAEGSLIGSKPRALPPLLPRVIPRDPVGGTGTTLRIDSRTFAPSMAGWSMRPSKIAARRCGCYRCRSSTRARSMR